MTPGDDPAVDAEARIGRQDDLERVVLVERPLVDDVVEPAADQRGDRDDDHAVADEVGVLARALREPDEQQVRGGEPDRVADPVPEHGEWPDLERDRVRSEVEHPRSVPAPATGAATTLPGRTSAHPGAPTRPADAPYTSRR